MSEEEKINGEFAKKLTDAVSAFFLLDEVCDQVREKKVCDAVGVKCDASCKIYVKKDKLLKFMEECIKALPSAPVVESAPIIPVETEKPAEESKPWRPEPTPEKPKERLCPSCGQKAAREQSKYCDYCGEEF